MAKSKRDTLAAITRDAIEAYARKESLYELAQRSDVTRSTLWRFTRGESSLTLDTFDRVNKVLGIRFTRR